MAKATGGPPRFLTPVIWLGILGVLGVVVLVVLKLGAAFQEGWGEIEERRARDHAIITAQKTAGLAYMDSIDVSMKVGAAVGTERRKIPLTFTIRNNGDRNVLKAFAEVSFATPKADVPRHTEQVLIFDASELSVRTDSPVMSGGEETFTVWVEAGEDWDLRDVEYKIIKVRVNLVKDVDKIEGD